MHENLTRQAAEALELATAEARRTGKRAIATEHILFGLLKLSARAALVRKVIADLGADAEDIARTTQEIIDRDPRGDPLSEDQEVGYTPHAKRVLELARAEATDMGLSLIGTEHLLIGLVREEEGVAAIILLQAGLDKSGVKRRVRHLIKRSRTGAVTAARPAELAETPTLDKFGIDLTELARRGKLDPVIGRIVEIRRVMQILTRRAKNNPIIIGEPGTGKTAIVEGLAQDLVKEDIPEILQGKRIVCLDLPRVVAGTKFRGQFEERLKTIIDEVTAAENIFLFIDEIHTLIGTGSAEGSLDAGNILKPALSRGHVQCIGATTLDEFKKNIEKDGGLNRRFQPVLIDPPTREETVKILRGLRDRLEAHHRLRITDEAIQAAVDLSDRFVSDRFLPDKAIDVLDEAAAREKLRYSLPPAEAAQIDVEIENLVRERQEDVMGDDVTAMETRRDIERLRRRRAELLQDWHQQRHEDARVVDVEHVKHAISETTGIPQDQLSEDELGRLQELGAELGAVVIGQDEAVDAVVRAVKRARSGVKNPQRPIGSFLFAGPTGVGKTHLTRELSRILFGEREAFFQLDMSEYSEKHSIARMIGAPPGYVGHEEGGQLTEKVRRKPYSVILFDEIEKAHPDVFNVLLQILEEGKLTDGLGRTVDFKNTIIVMTSNVGVREAEDATRPSVGFGGRTEDDEARDRRDAVLAAIKDTFRPEFINRIDSIVIFNSLGRPELHRIVDLEVARVADRIAGRGYQLMLSPAAKDLLLERGFDPRYGVRPLRRVIESEIEDPLSEAIIDGHLRPGMAARFGARSGKLHLRCTTLTKRVEATVAE
jgi:ATP-dependent Clp protease ATP-binding subunit ClpC